MVLQLADQKVETMVASSVDLSVGLMVALLVGQMDEKMVALTVVC